VPSSERKVQVKAQLQRLKARTTEIVEAESLTFSVRRPGPPQGEDIEIQLVSGNDDQRQTAANALVEILNQIIGLTILCTTNTVSNLVKGMYMYY
jgi:multidrug efflux pump subunit AcrB